MDLFNPTNLATGGLIAAVIAFWGQVRKILSHISSLVVLQINLDSPLGDAALLYLRSSFKQPPTGILNYAQYSFLLRSNKYANVVFRVLGESAIFYKGKTVVLATSGARGVKLLTLRGMMNADDFVVKAKNFRSGLFDDADTNVSNFQVFVKVGREKGPWAVSSRTAERGDDPPAPAPSGLTSTSQASSGLASGVWPSIDPALEYSKADLVFDKSVDPLQGLFYDQDILIRLEDAKRWRKAQDWYATRIIPWKRGWMLYGPPGTGKSSLAKVVAKTINLPIYQYMLSTMSDQEFIRFWSEMSPPCVVLFEDFDTVFDKRQPLTEHKSLTFDCVLNQLSGVKSADGVFLIVTTNDISKIDEAMGVASKFGTVSTRPGRIDQMVYLGPTSKEVRIKMASHILRDWPDVQAELVEQGDGTTAVQFQEMCIQRAFGNINGVSHV